MNQQNRLMWHPQTTHGNCGKRKKWQRNLDLTIALLEGGTLRSLADKYDISPCMASTVFRTSIADLKRHHGSQIEGLPTSRYRGSWDLRAMRHYKEILIPLLRELDQRRVMNRQERRIQKAIDELIKIQDDGKGTGEVQHVLDRLNALETYFAQLSERKDD